LAQFTLQGVALGISVHFMAGFDADAAREAFGVPDEFAIVCMAAVGRRDAPDVLPSDLAERERASRQRRPQSSWVFADRWGTPWSTHDERAPEAILAFWFGEGAESGSTPTELASRWWKKDEAFDADVRRRFEALYDEVRSGRRDEWLSSARGRLATILVLDQFPRNMFRGTARMYEADGRALDIASSGIDLGLDRALPGDLRAFFYMPLMHAESLRTQEACVRLFEVFAGELPGPEGERIRNNLKFAEQHRDVVARFGRFPHRNRIVGRESTEAEDAFLAGGGASF